MAEEIEGGAVVNTSPRPRMLVWGFSKEEELVAELLRLCPTSRHIESLRQVRQAEWDVLVTDGQLQQTFENSGVTLRVEPHLCVIYRSASSEYSVRVEHRPGWKTSISSRPGVVSQEIRRMRNLPERIAMLVHEKLEPVITQRRSHLIYEHRSVKIPATATAPRIVPFIATADNVPLAGKYDRSDSSEAWILPADTPEFATWVQAALAEWHSLAPARFPGVPDWSNQPAWLTTEELAITSEIAKVEQERAEQLDRLQKIENELRARLSLTRESADKYERALLTTQSDELKNATIRALEEIGFTVVDADENADPDDHLEDLRITDPDVPNWIALGEVKGYARGAKTEGLTQFLLFNIRYTAKTGKNTDA